MLEKQFRLYQIKIEQSESEIENLRRFDEQCLRIRRQCFAPYAGIYSVDTVPIGIGVRSECQKVVSSLVVNPE